MNPIMTDTELFAEVLNRICKKYNVTYNYEPVGIYEFFDVNGDSIGSANFAGYNLLAKLTMLTELFKGYLL